MNVTLSLPEEIVKKARHRAVDRGVSLSRYVADLLAQQVDLDPAWEEARQRHRAAVASGEYEAAKQRYLARPLRDLGTHGKIAWTREELHER